MAFIVLPFALVSSTVFIHVGIPINPVIDVDIFIDINIDIAATPVKSTPRITPCCADSKPCTEGEEARS
jgi:hypothetical protein